MALSRSASYALRAMAILAALPPDGFAGAAALAERMNAPANYLGKLLQTLAAAGVVESRKGPGGGFRLSRPAASITLLEALEPLEQFSRWQGCILGLPQCSDEAPCPLHRGWGRLRDDYLALFSATRLEDIVDKGGKE